MVSSAMRSPSEVRRAAERAEGARLVAGPDPLVRLVAAGPAAGPAAVAEARVDVECALVEFGHLQRAMASRGVVRDASV